MSSQTPPPPYPEENNTSWYNSLRNYILGQIQAASESLSQAIAGKQDMLPDPTEGAGVLGVAAGEYALVDPDEPVWMEAWAFDFVPSDLGYNGVDLETNLPGVSFFTYGGTDVDANGWLSSASEDLSISTGDISSELRMAASIQYRLDAPTSVVSVIQTDSLNLTIDGEGKMVFSLNQAGQNTSLVLGEGVEAAFDEGAWQYIVSAPLFPTSGTVGWRRLPNKHYEFSVDGQVVLTVYAGDPDFPNENYYVDFTVFGPGALREGRGEIFGNAITMELLDFSLSVQQQINTRVRRVQGEFPDESGDITLSGFLNRINGKYEVPGSGDMRLPGFFLGKWVAPVASYQNLNFNSPNTEYAGYTWNAGTYRLTPDYSWDGGWPDRPSVFFPPGEQAFFNGRPYTVRLDKDFGNFNWNGDGVDTSLVIEWVAINGLGEQIVVQQDGLSIARHPNRWYVQVLADMASFGLADDHPLGIRFAMSHEVGEDIYDLQVTSPHLNGAQRGDFVAHNGTLYQSIVEINESEPGVGEGWLELTSSVETSIRTSELSTANPVAQLGSFSDFTVTEPVTVQLPPRPPGFTGTVKVTGYQNLTWPAGTLVYGGTFDDTVWVNLIREEDHWTVLVPSSAPVADA